MAEDSPKVPEAAIKAVEDLLNATPVLFKDMQPRMRERATRIIETVAPHLFSALLSDEVVEVVAQKSFERCMQPTGHPQWQSVSEHERDRWRREAAADLQSAIEQVGGRDTTTIPAENEDPDDLCDCGHERFHHDDGREMGVLTHCKARGCTCKQFEQVGGAK